MKYKLNLIGLVIGILLVSFPMIFSQAYSLPSRLGPRTLVNDYENLLSTAQRNALEQKLSNFAAQHQVGITIIITDNLYGYDILDFSARIGEAWGVGQAGSESGVVVTVVPGRSADVRREVAISTGYGMEGVIPDAVAKRIVENEVLPNFRQQRYFEGLDAATNELMKLASGEFPASEYGQAEEVPPGAILAPFILILLIVFFLSRSKRRFDSPGKAIPFWTLFWLLSHGSRGSRGSYGSFSSGSGSFGRTGGMGSGGGFSGFGGGRFGGGGARGSW